MTAQQMYQNLVGEYGKIDETKELFRDLRSSDPQESGNARLGLERLINGIAPGSINAQTSDSFIATKITELEQLAIISGRIAMRLEGDAVIDAALSDKPEKFKENYLRVHPVKTGNKDYDENVLPHHLKYAMLYDAIDTFRKDSNNPQALQNFIRRTYQFVEADALTRVAGFGKNRIFLSPANADDGRDLDSLSNIDRLLISDALSQFPRMSANEAIAYVAGLAAAAKSQVDNNLPEAERANYAIALLKHARAEAAKLRGTDPAKGEEAYARVGRNLYDIVAS